VSRLTLLVVGALVALAAHIAPAPAAAQADGLERIERLIAAGDYPAARAGLGRWWTDHDVPRLPGAQRARALMIRAQLATDPAAAEEDYLSVVLGYPLSPDAPRALLRLGQGLLVLGQPDRAAGYLKRLVADYPGRPERATGLLWLARAHHAARQNAAACAAAREGLRDAADPDLAAMLRVEERAACDGAPTPAGRAAAATPPATQAAPQAAPQPLPSGTVRTPEARPAADAGAGRYTVQTGAYRQQESVTAAVARLRRAGYDPRVVRLPGSELTRTRVGRFATAREASAFMAQLARDGFDGVVVSDAHQERQP
jgi:cell division septation protein DedD